jgi:xanthine dehydrogenase accessory factor
MGNGDEEGLLSVLRSKPRYFGLVASEKKSQALFEYARQHGYTDEQLGQIKCPAGLEISAQTMSEIALSVIAEITQIRRTVSEQPTMPAEAIDPICGMKVDPATAKYSSEFNGRTIYFCCLHCKETFDRS